VGVREGALHGVWQEIIGALRNRTHVCGMARGAMSPLTSE
jgi:hypothetical protein